MFYPLTWFDHPYLYPLQICYGLQRMKLIALNNINGMMFHSKLYGPCASWESRPCANDLPIDGPPPRCFAHLISSYAVL